MARVNEVVRETIADELERLSDPRLGFVTVTGVDVSPDLRHATVYYSALESRPEAPKRRRSRRAGQERLAEVDVTAEEPMTKEQVDFKERSRAALRSAAPHLRTELGRQVRLKYTPELTFLEDPAIEQGQRIEAIIRELHAREDQSRASE
ncbi:MAG: ribosome-binding factor A [Acidimicrobiia bacterium]